MAEKIGPVRIGEAADQSAAEAKGKEKCPFANGPCEHHNHLKRNATDSGSELNGVNDLDDTPVPQGVEVAVGATGILEPAARKVGTDVGQLDAD